MNIQQEVKASELAKIRNATTRILTILEVAELTTLSKSTLYRMIKAGEFPTPISVSASRSGFHSFEIEQWILSRTRVSI